MMNIPIIPILKILKQFAKAKNLPLNPKSWESIVRTFILYNEYAQTKN